MLFFYLDASALAKRYAWEAGTAVINHLFARVATERFTIFNVGTGEVLSILVRKRNAGYLSGVAFSQALLEFTAEVVHAPRLHKLAADEALVTGALPLIQAHSINATDSIILRSALDLAYRRRAAEDDLVLVASDHRLLRAAQAEGLLTFDPETQDAAALDALLGP